MQGKANVDRLRVVQQRRDVIQDGAAALDHPKHGEELRKVLQDGRVVAVLDAEVVRLAIVLKPFLHCAVADEVPDRGLHRGLGSQVTVDVPARFQRVPLFVEAGISSPPVHLEIPGQNVQQRFVQGVDVGVDAGQIDLANGLLDLCGDCGRERECNLVLLQDARKRPQEVLSGQSVGISHPPHLRS